MSIFIKSSLSLSQKTKLVGTMMIRWNKAVIKQVAFKAKMSAMEDEGDS